MAARFRENPVFTPMPNHLADMREKYALTIAKIAQRAEVAKGSYATIESGHCLPSKPLLDRLCKLFRCKPLDLYAEPFVIVIEGHHEVMQILHERAKVLDEVEVVENAVS